MQRRYLFAATVLIAFVTGCANHAARMAVRDVGGAAALVQQFVAYDGPTGETIDWAAVSRKAARADVVLFGEEHNDVVCNQIQAQLLAELAATPGPLALAMEFIERDAQATLDEFLAGKLDEAAFRDKARQGRLYPVSHRPLINLCAKAGIPVIAANAPRRLVREYRLSGKEFRDYRASLSPADQALLPARSDWLPGKYYQNFLEVMRPHGEEGTPTSQPDAEAQARLDRAYRSQLLWDDSMAEAIAQYRDKSPDSRVMLLVGSFHVANEGGTLAKYRMSRPNDRVFTILYRGSNSTPLALDAADKGAADVVLVGITPKPAPKPTSGPAE